MKDPVSGLDIPDTGYFEYGTLVAHRYLRDRLPSEIVVASQVPNPRPTRLVVIRTVATGGAMSLALSRRRLIIHCYDTTEALACRLAEMVRGYLIDGMHTHASGFRNVNMIGEPSYLPDPSDPSNTPRSIMTVDLLLRAHLRPPATGGS